MSKMIPHPPIIRLTAGLLALLVLVSAVLAAPVAPSTPEIVGGRPADPGEWSWQVALISKTPSNPNDADDFELSCGGSLIDRQWVLTAAHCFNFKTAADYDVVAGFHDLTAPAPGFQRVAIAAVIIHPDYDIVSNDYDIALLQLAEPIDERPADGATLPIAYVPLVPADIGPLAGVEATVTGWGSRDGSSAGDPPVLYEVEVPIITNAECDAAFDGDITDSMLCAGIPEGGLGPCFGDSGGPLIVFDEARNRWELAGVVNRGNGSVGQPVCGAANFSGIYARVSSYINWLNDVTGLCLGMSCVAALPLVGFNGGPDLVVAEIAIDLTGIRVTITNNGSGTTTGPYWLDLYIKPSPAPAWPNDVWNDGRSRYGAVWHLDAPLRPGESLTLRVGDAHYRPALSRLPGALAAGTPVYAQVDSADTETTFGGVHEIHEVAGSGLPYNNIVAVEVEEDTVFAVDAPAPQASETAAAADLPTRPTH